MQQVMLGKLTLHFDFRSGEKQVRAGRLMEIPASRSKFCMDAKDA
jgi:hypothetical protein